MGNKSDARRRIEDNGLLIISVGVAFIYWILDIAFAGQLLSRLFFTCLLITYGIFTQYLINRHKVLTNLLRDSHNQLEDQVRSRTAELVAVNEELKREVSERKIIEDVLKQSENTYRTIFETTGTATTILSEDGTCFLVNDEFVKLSGYSKEELTRSKLVDLIAREDVYSIEKYLELKDINPLIDRGLCEFRFVAKDGKIRNALLAAAVIPGTGRTVVSIIDISDRKRSELELRESEERYRTILEDIEEGYHEVDLSGNYTYLNESFAKIVGYSRDELLAMNYRLHANAENAAKIYREYNRMFKTGIPLKRYEWDIIRKDGVWRTVEVSASLIRDAGGRPKGFRGIVSDVTDRKHEEALYRTMANSSQVGVYIVRNGKMCFANPYMPEYLKYTEEELLDKKLLNFVHPEDREMVRLKAIEMLKGLSNSPYEYRIIDQNGNVRWLLEKVTPITYMGEKAVLGNAMDITEHRQVEEEKKRLESQLLQSQKMESIGTLAGGIAHDFNNLLMGIQGYASRMLSNIDTGHPFYEKLKGIEEQVESGADLTKQLLGFARAGRYAIKPTDLNDVLKKTSNMFGRTKKEITIHRKYGENLWPVEVDQGQIEQVMLNLYVNAWQAMPGGGDLYLETMNVTLDENYTKAFTIVPGNYVKISVTDTGVGMDERTKERIFEPFFTTKEMGRGTGLGLATVYGIIKGHKGIINVYSDRGHGTTFNIYVPASSKAVIRDEDYPRKPFLGQETVLVVDDEEVIRDVTKDLLEDLGYRVLMAGSGAEAIEIYRANKDKIQLVILDMIMPAMSGGETFDLLRSINPEIKVILSSGYSLNGLAIGILDRGCRAFIQKPFNAVTLSRKVREVLEAGLH